VAALRAAGHSVSLLAPSGAGRVLAGPGPGEVEAVLPWEAASTATLLAGAGAIAPDLARALAPFSAIVAYTSSLPLLEGLRASGARVIAKAPSPPETGPHAARWLAEAVVELGADASVAPPPLHATADERLAARAWVERLGPGFIAVHPGSGSPRKNWPADRFAGLVAALSPDRPWLLVEGPADGEAAESLTHLPHVVHARDLLPRVLGTVLAQAGLYVGNDSGVSHLAAAFGAPTLALFGPTDPAQWAPVGPMVTCLRSEDRTMDGLDVDEVIRAARTHPSRDG
jgi:heptosyltransferase III